MRHRRECARRPADRRPGAQDPLHVDRDSYVCTCSIGRPGRLSAEPFVRSTTSFGVDLVTGRLKTVPEAPTIGTMVPASTPPCRGANHWQPSAYSRARGSFIYAPDSLHDRGPAPVGSATWHWSISSTAAALSARRCNAKFGIRRRGVPGGRHRPGLDPDRHASCCLEVPMCLVGEEGQEWTSKKS
jgi:hypothetical protein